MTIAHQTTPATDAYAIRAAAHAADESVLRHAQHWQDGVSDLDVTRVMFAIETGTQICRNRYGRWLAHGNGPVPGGWHLSSTVNEMIRTGLLRHYKDRDGDHLIPALVHARSMDDHNLSACLFTGEDMGPMRSRLVDRLDLVDCLNCERALATGQARGL